MLDFVAAQPAGAMSVGQTGLVPNIGAA
jgi:hypothetical protein